ncbi:hypothetical protein Ade02nite_11040 [Paractinoplanes deccanensis]|uniref:DUF4240 domain-containing protein n=1 Tax=Paractinoplanes deccanensis TaxID=113561 RepID=A0ABQ3XXI3_9ACTN|nr:DUF4240 domain-containing protein [Actinoplanes deccanensis]GID72463.1 hypothetical protein Ade02nite_11040 [Actinoplanes deccanensis]
MDETLNKPGRVPTAADEDRFWSLIETAWQRLGPEPLALRRALLERDPADEDFELYAIDGWLEAFLRELTALTTDLNSADLTALDRVLERKLHDIDRADIHEVTDGSDDGFLYARGFIVALGRDFYEAVRHDPAVAVLDADCEEMCYFFAHLHEARFNAWPETGSAISRETGNNLAGWTP